MTTYTATIKHHSIASAREINIVGDLVDAEHRAADEFGGELRDATIAIYDTTPGRAPEIVSQRKVGDRRWIRSVF